MKRMKSLLMLAAIAVASLSIVSCDDDPWDDPYSHWHGWGDGYNQEERPYQQQYTKTTDTTSVVFFCLRIVGFAPNIVIICKINTCMVN